MTRTLTLLGASLVVAATMLAATACVDARAAPDAGGAQSPSPERHLAGAHAGRLSERDAAG